MYILGFMFVDGDFFIFCLCMFVATMLMFTKFNNCYLIEKFLITYIIVTYSEFHMININMLVKDSHYLCVSTLSYVH